MVKVHCAATFGALPACIWHHDSKFTADDVTRRQKIAAQNADISYRDEWEQWVSLLIFQKHMMLPIHNLALLHKYVHQAYICLLYQIIARVIAVLITNCFSLPCSKRSCYFSEHESSEAAGPQTSFLSPAFVKCSKWCKAEVVNKIAWFDRQLVEYMAKNFKKVCHLTSSRFSYLLLRIFCIISMPNLEIGVQ